MNQQLVGKLVTADRHYIDESEAGDPVGGLCEIITEWYIRSGLLETSEFRENLFQFLLGEARMLVVKYTGFRTIYDKDDATGAQTGYTVKKGVDWFGLGFDLTLKAQDFIGNHHS